MLQKKAWRHLKLWLPYISSCRVHYGAKQVSRTHQALACSDVSFVARVLQLAQLDCPLLQSQADAGAADIQYAHVWPHILQVSIYGRSSTTAYIAGQRSARGVSSMPCSVMHSTQLVPGQTTMQPSSAKWITCQLGVLRRVWYFPGNSFKVMVNLCTPLVAGTVS